MKFVVFVIGTCIILIAVLVAVAYICDRLNINLNATTKNVPIQATAADYTAVGDVLVRCVAEIYSVLGLVRPTDLFLHAAPVEEMIQQRQGVGVVFTYYFERSGDISHGGALNSAKLPVSTVATSVMKKKLSALFAPACICSELGSYDVYSVIDVPGSRVRVEIIRGF